jgi:hypothetical protein
MTSGHRHGLYTRKADRSIHKKQPPATVGISVPVRSRPYRHAELQGAAASRRSGPRCASFATCTRAPGRGSLGAPMCRDAELVKGSSVTGSASPTVTSSPTDADSTPREPITRFCPQVGQPKAPHAYYGQQAPSRSARALGPTVFRGAGAAFREPARRGIVVPVSRVVERGPACGRSGKAGNGLDG